MILLKENFQTYFARPSGTGGFCAKLTQGSPFPFDYAQGQGPPWAIFAAPCWGALPWLQHPTFHSSRVGNAGGRLMRGRSRLEGIGFGIQQLGFRSIGPALKSCHSSPPIPHITQDGWGTQWSVFMGRINRGEFIGWWFLRHMGNDFSRAPYAAK